MFLLIYEIDAHFGRGHRLTIIKGTSQQVASRNYEIINRRDNPYPDSLSGLYTIITEDELTDNFYGHRMHACEDGIFIFTQEDKTGVVTPHLMYPGIRELIAQTTSISGVIPHPDTQAEIVQRCLNELNAPHEFPTIFDYVEFPTEEKSTNRLNLLDVTLEETVGKNVYFRKKGTNELYGPYYGLKDNVFLTTDEVYLDLRRNPTGRTSFVQHLPWHKPDAAKHRFA